jgi:hypothetical protein
MQSPYGILGHLIDVFVGWDAVACPEPKGREGHPDVFI